MKHSVIETANYPRSLTQDVSNGLHAQAGKKELLDPILVRGVLKQMLNRANSAHKKGLDQCEAWETDRTISTLRLEPLGKAEHEQQQIVVGFGIGRLGNTGQRQCPAPTAAVSTSGPGCSQTTRAREATASALT